MAIHPDIPGLEVEIIVDGQVAKEYDQPTEEEVDASVIALDSSAPGQDSSPASSQSGVVAMDETIRYIEAKADVNFAFRFRVKPGFMYPNHDLRFMINVDGVISERKTFGKDEIAGGRDLHLDSVRLVQNGTGIRRKFLFAELKTDDSGIDQNLLEKTKKMGRITCKVYRVQLYNERSDTQPSRHWRQNINNDNTILPEKALKGRSLSCRTSLDSAEPIHQQLRIKRSVQYIDSINKPLATFVFRYGSIEDLHKQFIVPRPAEPSIDDMSAIQLRQYAAKLKADLEKQERLNRRRAQNTEQRVLKRDAEEEDEITGPEGSNSFKRRHIITQVQEIDLTGDSD
ncbi:hypothetical protein FKW77_006843 [Venturia effusa]|uniref:DUF7918 domain-containing protein n=1 Tax=Venturia effusa TaxID=50376 RepID=A0A517LKF7_9PEZI|nr:hypothetical protein FKW77_006843 [Venturia effusa]